MPPLGSHILLDLWGARATLLDDGPELERRLVAAAERAGAHVRESHICRFQPQGISGVVILAESHLALHTWPELGCAAVDIFTCGDAEVAERIAGEVLAAIETRQHSLQRVARGVAPAPSAAAAHDQRKAS